MSESEGDKKRNKLGYQRISVACAHCRRRKIRCVMADGDPHNRCQNCIRLNKECIFHPVEQQQGTSESGSASGQQTASIAHSPRDIVGGQVFDARPNNSYTRLAPLLSNAPQIFTSLPYDSHSTQITGTPHSSVIDYRSQQFGDARWPVTDGVTASVQAQAQAPLGDGVDGGHGLYWNNANDEYSNLSSVNRTISPDARSYPYSGGLSADQQWQMLHQPGRGMPSFGGYDAPPQFAPHQGMTGPTIQQPLTHHSTFPIDTHSASSMRAVPGPHSAPISGDSVANFPPTTQHYGYQNAAYHSQQDMSGSWLSSHEQQGYGDFVPGHMDGSSPADSTRRS